MKVVDYQLSVGGMHCADCENVLEDAVSSLPGIVSVNASFADESVALRLDTNVISLTTVCSAINSAGKECKS